MSSFGLGELTVSAIHTSPECMRIIVERRERIIDAARSNVRTEPTPRTQGIPAACRAMRWLYLLRARKYRTGRRSACPNHVWQEGSTVCL